jgi:hypothetical protein
LSWGTNSANTDLASGISTNPSDVVSYSLNYFTYRNKKVAWKNSLSLFSLKRFHLQRRGQKNKIIN